MRGTLAALSNSTGLVLLVLGAVFVVAGTAALILRGRARDRGPDIPRGMTPGPDDASLETPLLQKLQGWGVLLVAFFVIWIPFTWLREPAQNLAQTKDLKTASIARG